MALQGSGMISIGDVASEFGDTHPSSLSEFRGKGNAPASGPVSLSNFYGASDIYSMDYLISVDTNNHPDGTKTYEMNADPSVELSGTSNTLTADSPCSFIRIGATNIPTDDKTKTYGITYGMSGVPNVYDQSPLGNTLYILDIIINGISLIEKGSIALSASSTRPITPSDLTVKFEQVNSTVTAMNYALGYPQVICEDFFNSIGADTSSVNVSILTQVRPVWV